MGQRKSTHEKTGCGGVVPPKEYRFSATNQPSREAKSAGLRRWQERNRLKENLLRVFIEELPGSDGTKTVAMAAIARRVRNFLLEKNPKGMSAKQVELALKTFELLAPKKLEVGAEAGGKAAVVLLFDKEDKAA